MSRPCCEPYHPIPIFHVQSPSCHCPIRLPAGPPEPRVGSPPAGGHPVWILNRTSGGRPRLGGRPTGQLASWPNPEVVTQQQQRHFAAASSMVKRAPRELNFKNLSALEVQASMNQRRWMSDRYASRCRIKLAATIICHTEERCKRACVEDRIFIADYGMSWRRHTVHGEPGDDSFKSKRVVPWLQHSWLQYPSSDPHATR